MDLCAASLLVGLTHLSVSWSGSTGFSLNSSYLRYQTGWDKKGPQCVPTGQFRRAAGGCATHFLYATWRSAIDTIPHWLGQGKSWEDVVRKNSASKNYLRRTGSNRLDFTSESHKRGAARAKTSYRSCFRQNHRRNLFFHHRVVVVRCTLQMGTRSWLGYICSYFRRIHQRSWNRHHTAVFY